MRIIQNYTPPTTDDLVRLKDTLKLNGTQMAELAGLAAGSQWRKYTGGESPRAMSAQMLFFMAAQLVLEKDQIDAVLAKMRELGAEVS